MPKRVQFSEPLEEVESFYQQDQQLKWTNVANGQDPSARWYTPLELRSIRRDLHDVLFGNNAGQVPHPNPPQDDSMRGLEIFQSKTRRELQRYFIRTVLDYQNVIKQQKQEGCTSGCEDDSLLLQQASEQFSQYAKDMAIREAIRDAEDSVRINQDATKKSALIGKQRVSISPIRRVRTGSSNNPALRGGRMPPKA